MTKPGSDLKTALLRLLSHRADHFSQRYCARPFPIRSKRGPVPWRGLTGPMSRSTEDVKNWMNMFRWIVKLIRDEFGIDEKILVRTATLETDMGLSIEQVEQVLEYIAESFQVRFPENTLDEIVKLEEL